MCLCVDVASATVSADMDQDTLCSRISAALPLLHQLVGLELIHCFVMQLCSGISDRVGQLLFLHDEFINRNRQKVEDK